MKPPMTYNPDTRGAIFLYDPEEIEDDVEYDDEPDVDEMTEWFDYDPDC